MQENNDTIKLLSAELKTGQLQLAGISSGAVVILVGGAIFYHLQEQFSWLNSFYFCTITLTTVGYGDLVPKTDLGKFFTIFYVLVGIGVIATFANLLIKNSGIRRQLKHERRKARRASKNEVADSSN